MKVLCAYIFLLFSYAAYAQNEGVHGVVLDSTGSPLVSATVRLQALIDTTIVQIVATNSAGEYNFQNVSKGTYQLQISFIGFYDFHKLIQFEGISMLIENVVLRQKLMQTNAVKIFVNKASIIKDDTMQYNANAYKTNPDATAEDLVKKMPGISVENGTVKAQGENVGKVTVDGKTFFGEDATVALRNLSADMVEKIEVFDMMSDQAMFTGFDDGNSTKTMNIVTKEKYRNGTNGKVYIGAGTDYRYQGGGTINYFSPKRRISLLALTNNINQQNFSSDDITAATGAVPRDAVGKGGGFNANNPTGFVTPLKLGVTSVNSFGVNYNENLGNKVKMVGSYFFNQSNNNNNQNMLRTYFSSNSTVAYYSEIGTYNSQNYNHRFNFKFDYKIDSVNSFSLVPNIYIQMGNINNTIEGSNNGEAAVINNTQNNFTSAIASYRISNDLVFRHAFLKKGRSFSSGFQSEWNSKTANSILTGINEYVGTLITDTLDQNTVSHTANQNYAVNVNYTEPIAAGMVLLFNAKENYTPNASTIETNKYNVALQSYSIFDTVLSSAFQSNYFTHSVGAGWRFNNKKLHVMLAGNFQQVDLYNEQTMPFNTKVSKSFKNFVPNLNIKYKFSQGNNLRINYKTQVNVPSVLKLQEVWNYTNPLLLSTGNASLKASYVNSINVKWLLNNNLTSRNLMLFAMISQTRNYSASSTQLVSDDVLLSNGLLLKKGTRYTKPINLDGCWSARTYLMFGMPVKLIKSNINFSAGYSYNRTPSVVNGIGGFSYASSYNGSVVFSSNVSEKIDFTLSSNATYSDISTTLQIGKNYNYFNLLTSAKVNFMFWNGTVLQSEVSHTWYTGLQLYNRSYFLWNIAVAKKFMKEQHAEMRLSVFDVLMQNNSVSRTVSDYYVDDIRNVVLQQYYMLTFTYKFKKFKAENQ